MSFQVNLHFFKKIEENSLRNGELRIPRSFVHNCWKGVSNPVHLLLPNGAKWEVNWKKLDSEVWLTNNWKKFAEFYALDEDYLLVFRYVGKSRFQVVIFDQSALEIRYPLLDAEENVDSLRQSKRPKSPLPFSPTKKIKTNPNEEPKRYSTQPVETEHAQFRRTKLEMKKFNADFDNAKPKITGGGGIIHVNRRCSNSEALERAKAFSSENPFFIRKMRPSYIERHVLAIPGYFIRAYQKKKDGSVTLWVCKERTWNVKFKLNGGNGQLHLTTGWKKFAKDNNLKLGDVCVFEQTKSTGISFRVVIFRDIEESSHPLFQAHGDEANSRKQTGLQSEFAQRDIEGIPKMYPRTNFEDSENQRITFPGYNNKTSENHFTITIKSTEWNYKTVPTKFLRNHAIGNVNYYATLQVGKKSWLVKLHYYPKYNFGRFSAVGIQEVLSAIFKSNHCGLISALIGPWVAMDSTMSHKGKGAIFVFGEIGWVLSICCSE
ncbi:hypothetical protein VNO77_12011 [Canavalia gladiata]|uniref:TF-B3 domain-containing protein n=1 Tax=Canavalia gladiata TaxID=3824 RepID=A0AAN9LWW2_CANGL